MTRWCGLTEVPGRSPARSACRTPPGTRTFVGDLWLPPEEDFAIIPRPGSADIAFVDPDTLTLAGTTHTGRQPLAAAVLDGGCVIARDWKTGDLLRANLS